MSRAALFLLFFNISISLNAQNVIDNNGALIRSDTLQKNIFLCFTGHDYYDGFAYVQQILKDKNIKASFFLTGDFVRNHADIVKELAEEGHFVGAHSNKHLLYNDWSNRDSLLHSPNEIKADISDNLQALKELGIHPDYFMPPYEWCNQKIVEIAKELNQITVNFSPGTRSNADYTTPDLPNYISSKAILESIYAYEKTNGMNGFHLLIHPGVSPLRKDKFYLYLDKLLSELNHKGYNFLRF